MNTLVVVMAIVIVVLVALVAAALGFMRARKRAERTFEGTFTFGWEVSSFVPGPPSKSEPRYWVAWTPESGFMDAFKAAGYDPAWSPGFGKVRTKFVGKLETTANGGYGHMGRYSAQITVLRVVEMSQAEPGG